MPRYRLQIVDLRVHNPFDGTELFQERLGLWFNVLPPDHIGEEEFQRLVLMEGLNSCGREFLLQALSVAPVVISMICLHDGYPIMSSLLTKPVSGMTIKCLYQSSFRQVENLKGT